MSSYSEGQTHQLMNKLELAGFTPKHITILGQIEELRFIKDFLEGNATLSFPEHPIQLDNDADLSNGCKIRRHVNTRNESEWEWDASQIDIDWQWGRDGFAFLKQLDDQPVLNVNVLEYLLRRQHLIPEEWRQHIVCFWGTVYELDGPRDLYVPALGIRSGNRYERMDLPLLYVLNGRIAQWRIK